MKKISEQLVEAAQRWADNDKLLGMMVAKQSPLENEQRAGSEQAKQAFVELAEAIDEQYNAAQNGWDEQHELMMELDGLYQMNLQPGWDVERIKRRDELREQLGFVEEPCQQ